MLVSFHSSVTWLLVLAQLVGGLGVFCDEGVGQPSWELLPCACVGTSQTPTELAWSPPANDACGPCQDTQAIAIQRGDDERVLPPPPLQISMLALAAPMPAAASLTDPSPRRRAGFAREGPGLVGTIVLTC